MVSRVQTFNLPDGSVYSGTLEEVYSHIKMMKHHSYYEFIEDYSLYKEKYVKNNAYFLHKKEYTENNAYFKSVPTADNEPTLIERIKAFFSPRIVVKGL